MTILCYGPLNSTRGPPNLYDEFALFELSCPFLPQFFKPDIRFLNASEFRFDNKHKAYLKFFHNRARTKKDYLFINQKKFLCPAPWPLIRPARSFCLLGLCGLCLLGLHFLSESKVCDLIMLQLNLYTTRLNSIAVKTSPIFSRLNILESLQESDFNGADFSISFNAAFYVPASDVEEQKRRPAIFQACDISLSCIFVDDFIPYVLF